MLLLPLRAPVTRQASHKSRQAALELPCVRVTHYHMRECSAVRCAGGSIDAELAVHGISWLLLHSPSHPDRPVGLRVGLSAGHRYHEADSTPKVAPAGGHTDGRAADLWYTLCSHGLSVEYGT